MKRLDTILNKNGPVIIIEDDEDDRFILAEIFKQLDYPNEIIFCHDGEKALEYLNRSDTVPFIILSDVNVPKLSELSQNLKTDAALQVKCIPYLFFSTAVSQQALIDAYSLSAQGFFVKEDTTEKLRKTITTIMEYWKLCAAPNDFYN